MFLVVHKALEEHRCLDGRGLQGRLGDWIPAKDQDVFGPFLSHLPVTGFHMLDLPYLRGNEVGKEGTSIS
jgi:hypothetical protein